MNAEKLTPAEALEEWDTNPDTGLSGGKVTEHAAKWGENKLTAAKPKSLFSRIIEGLTEPMMIILLVALGITVTVNIIKVARGDRFDYIECVGIVAAIVISVTITIIMEGKSLKAFDALKRMGEDVLVKVRRDGKVEKIKQSELVAGDIVYFETGDKIPVDCRLLTSENFSVDESPLTGESHGLRRLLRYRGQRVCGGGCGGRQHRNRADSQIACGRGNATHAASAQARQTGQDNNFAWRDSGGGCVYNPHNYAGRDKLGEFR